MRRERKNKKNRKEKVRAEKEYCQTDFAADRSTLTAASCTRAGRPPLIDFLDLGSGRRPSSRLLGAAEVRHRLLAASRAALLVELSGQQKTDTQLKEWRAVRV